MLQTLAKNSLASSRVGPNGVQQAHPIMKSPILKRSLMVNGRKTSVSLEEEFWISLKEIAAMRQVPVSQLAQEIALTSQGNLSSAMRTFILEHFRKSVLERSPNSFAEMTRGAPVNRTAAK